MKEREVEIPIRSTKFKLHGILRGGFDKPLIILAHGLGGWVHETLMYNSARYFDNKGYSTLRLAFVGEGSDQRNISDFGINENALDIDCAVDYARAKGAKKICVIGHSYSGMAIVYSNSQKFDCAVLWDPSHTDSYNTLEAQLNLKKDFIYNKKLGAYISGLGPGYVISRKVFEDFKPGSVAKAREFKVSTLIVNAGFSKEMQKYGKDYAGAIDADTKRVVINGASHPFTEDGAMEKLFDLSYKWVDTRFNF